MKKKPRMYLLGTAIILLLMFTFSGCVASDPQAAQKYALRRYVQGDLKLDTANGEVTKFFDNHGGFHGDGETYIEIHFDDAHIGQAISDNEQWHPLPLSRDVQIVAYGLEEGNTSYGPTLHGEDFQPLVPEIENGYYILVDRQPEDYQKTQRDPDQEPGIHNRYSYNFTVGMYDNDNHILYVLVLDT